VFFKCENLQRGGAFKIRGAANLVLSLSGEALAHGRQALRSRAAVSMTSDSRLDWTTALPLSAQKWSYERRILDRDVVARITVTTTRKAP